MNAYKLLTQLTFLHANHAFACRPVSQKEFSKHYTPWVCRQITISYN
jgi:hypothetical protein